MKESSLSTSTLHRLAPTQVELDIPIAPDEMAAAEARAFAKLVKKVRLPGFRPGKVPRKVFEATYGSAAITGEAVDEIIPAAYAKALHEHDLDPVERPQVEVVEETEGRPLRLKATVEVRPSITLGQYKGMPVERNAVEISDEDVERSLVALAKERATLVPVDRHVALGDVVTLDYVGRIDGEPFEGGAATGQATELLEERFIPGFASGIAGMTAGQTKEVEAHFPPGYAQAELAGKTAVFSVTVHDVKALELPVLDDAFAVAISGRTTIEELRADLRERLAAIGEARERRTMANALMERLLEAHDFALPPSMVASEVEHLAGEAQESAAQAGRADVPEAGADDAGEEERRAAFRVEAESRVKGTLLIEAIAKAESIVATPADVRAELAALARQYGQPPERIRKALGSNVMALMDGIVRTKTIEFLVENAAVTVRAATPAAPA